jgi:hypothetical protein
LPSIGKITAMPIRIWEFHHSQRTSDRSSNTHHWKSQHNQFAENWENQVVSHVNLENLIYVKARNSWWPNKCKSQQRRDTPPRLRKHVIRGQALEPDHRIQPWTLFVSQSKCSQYSSNLDSTGRRTVNCPSPQFCLK